jgi:hypothetical protein
MYIKYAEAADGKEYSQLLRRIGTVTRAMDAVRSVQVIVR